MDPESVIAHHKLKRSLVFWRIISALAIMALIVVGLGKFYLNDTPHIARLPITGFITEDIHRSAAIELLIERPDVRGVIVHINSPGGTAAGAEQIFYDLRRLAEKKPLVAVIGTIGTSGGYIVAIAADHIIARETSLTGSIGVLFQSAEFTGLMKKLGITPIIFKSSPLKGQPSPVEPLSAHTADALEILLKDTYVWFSDLVRKRRHFDTEALERTADGRVFNGRQAIKMRLIDAIGGEREARLWLQANRGVSLALPTIDVEWGKNEGILADALDMFGGKLFKNERLTFHGLLSVWQP